MYKVKGDFDCRENNLTTLEGSPTNVGRHFDCRENNLTSLEGSPTTVGGDFVCYDNNLTTLVGSPKIVGRDFYCQSQKSGVRFTEEQVRDVCDVKGKIYV